MCLIIVHMIQYLSSLFLFRKRALRFYDNKTFRSAFWKISAALFVPHLGVLIFLIIEIQTGKMNQCQLKFLPVVWCDLMLGFMSIPMIYFGYRMGKHKEKINLQYQLEEFHTEGCD